MERDETLTADIASHVRETYSLDPDAQLSIHQEDADAPEVRVFSVLMLENEDTYKVTVVNDKIKEVEKVDG